MFENLEERFNAIKSMKVEDWINWNLTLDLTNMGVKFNELINMFKKIYKVR